MTGCNKDEITSVSSEVIVDDDIDNGTYDRTISIVFSSNGNATVSGAGDSVTATVSGNDVTITNVGTSKVLYVLSGSTNDGFLKIYSGRKQGITLNGVSITNTRGAAINVQGLAATPNKGKRVDLVLKGENSLTVHYCRQDSLGFFLNLFTRLCPVLVAACRNFRCHMWDLVP